MSKQYEKLNQELIVIFSDLQIDDPARWVTPLPVHCHIANSGGHVIGSS